MVAFDDISLVMQMINLLFALPLLVTLGGIGFAAILRLKDQPRAAWCLLGAVCLWSAEYIGIYRVVDLLQSLGGLAVDLFLPLAVISMVLGRLLTLGGWLLALYPLTVAGVDEVSDDETAITVDEE